MKTCVHLEPLELELESRGILLGEGGRSPYGADLGLWFPVDCLFDEAPLRARLGITDPPVTFEEYDGRAAGSDATWYCKECKRAIMGGIARYAAPGTPHVS